MMNWLPPSACRLIGHNWAGHGYAAQDDGVDMCTRCGAERDLQIHATATIRPAKHLRNA
jgi:hypothetical protein